MRGNDHDKSNACPHAAELSDLILGKLSQQRADALFDHLHDCPLCSARVRELDGLVDPMIEQLRDGKLPAYEREQGLQDLMREMPQLMSEYCDTSLGPWTTPPQSRRPEPPPPETFRDYELREKIGSGGMGSVYRAWHRRLKRDVAIKMLRGDGAAGPIAAQRFMKEVEAIGQVVHPLIVHATDAGTEEEWHYLVMEFVDGINLSQLVARLGPLEVTDAVAIVRQVALGLDFAHLKGLVHRDVKPSNVMLDREGAVKILDLSLVRLRQRWEQATPGDESDRSSPTADTSCGRIMGTADYMSPEQTVDFRQADRRSDVYSLGVTLFRLLTGRVPFPRDSVDAKLQAHREEPPPSLRQLRPDVPRELEAVYQQMLAKDPADRYPTMLDVVRALDQCWRALPRPTGTGTERTKPMDSTQGGAAAVLQAEEIILALRDNVGLAATRAADSAPQSSPRVVWGRWLAVALLLPITLVALGWTSGVLAPRDSGGPVSNARAASQAVDPSATATNLVLPNEQVQKIDWLPAATKLGSPSRLLLTTDHKALLYELTDTNGRWWGSQIGDPILDHEFGVGSVLALEASAEDQLFMVAGSEAPICFDKWSGEPVLELITELQQLSAAEVDWNHQRLYVGNLEGQLAVRDFRLAPDGAQPGANAGEATSEWRMMTLPFDPKEPVRDLDLSPDGTWLVTTHQDIEVFDTLRSRWLTVPRPMDAAIEASQEMWPQARFLATSDALLVAYPGRIQVWSLDHESEEITIQLELGLDAPLCAVDIAATAGLAVLGYRDGRVELWDLERRQVVDHWKLAFAANIEQLAISDDAAFLAVAGDGIVQALDLRETAAATYRAR